MLRTEPKSRYDQGDSAVLQLVDGPQDLRYALTAAAVARDRRLGRPSSPLTLLNRQKAVRYRGDGADDRFDAMVRRMADLRLHRLGSADGTKVPLDPIDGPPNKRARGRRAAEPTEDAGADVAVDAP